jgi:hypothetical protein
VKSEKAACDGLRGKRCSKSASSASPTCPDVEVQHWMHELIMEFSSQQFYDGRLQAAPRWPRPTCRFPFRPALPLISCGVPRHGWLLASRSSPLPKADLTANPEGSRPAAQAPAVVEISRPRRPRGRPVNIMYLLHRAQINYLMPSRKTTSWWAPWSTAR